MRYLYELDGTKVDDIGQGERGRSIKLYEKLPVLPSEGTWMPRPLLPQIHFIDTAIHDSLRNPTNSSML